jgi:hypothetical protein
MKLAEFERANQKASEMQASVPRAVSARYDRRLGRVVIALSSKVDVMFAPRDAEGVERRRRRRNWRRSRFLRQGWGFTSRSWMRICICRPCWRGFSGRASGWLRGWGLQAGVLGAWRSAKRRRRMGGWGDGRRSGLRERSRWPVARIR